MWILSQFLLLTEIIFQSTEVAVIAPAMWNCFQKLLSLTGGPDTYSALYYQDTFELTAKTIHIFSKDIFAQP